MSTTTAEHPLTGDHAELYELWLKPNGIIGWMPENGKVVVHPNAGKITWLKLRHQNPDGDPWANDIVVKSDSWTSDELITRSRDEDGLVSDTVESDLAVPVTERVRELAKATGIKLIEH
jgi:hypothetical protein